MWLEDYANSTNNVSQPIQSDLPAFMQPRATPSAWHGISGETTVFASEKLSQSLNSLKELAFDNWDGDGAVRITDTVIGNTKQIASQLLHLGAAPPDVVPNNNGTLSLEWERANGIGCLEIGNTQFSFFFRPKKGPTAYASGATSDFRELASTFVQSVLVSKPFMRNSAVQVSLALNCNAPV